MLAIKTVCPESFKFYVQPRYDLDEVLRLGRFAQISPKRAIHEVANRLGVSEPEAERFVRTKLSALKSKNFVQSVEMEFRVQGTVVADVYGILDEHGGWYFKLYMEHGRVQVVSCHAPKYAMTCQDGTRIPASRG